MKQSEYKFQSDDQSLIQGLLDKYISIPIVKILPKKLKPNIITICSVFFMLLCSLFTWIAFHGARWGFIAAGISVFLYATGDNVDGIHARATAQTSQMGEFLDHWLDSINVVIVNICIVFVLHLQGWVMVLYMVSMTVALFATVWKHHETGIFFRAKIGTSDGLLAIVILYILLFFYFKTPAFTYNGPLKINVASSLAYITILVSIITTVSILFSVRKNLIEYLPLILAMLVISIWVLTGMMNRLVAGLLIYGINIPVHGRFLLARLCRKKSQYRNWVISILSVIGLVILFIKDNFSFPVETYFIYTALVLLVLVSFRDLFRAVSLLGSRK